MPKIQKSLQNGTDGGGSVFDDHSNSIDLIEGDDMESSGLMSLSIGGGVLGGGGGSLKVGSDTVGSCFFLCGLEIETYVNILYRTPFWIYWEEERTNQRTESA